MKKLLLGIMLLMMPILSSCTEDDEVWKMENMMLLEEVELEEQDTNDGLISPGHDNLFD